MKKGSAKRWDLLWIAVCLLAVLMQLFLVIVRHAALLDFFMLAATPPHRDPVPFQFTPHDLSAVTQFFRRPFDRQIPPGVEFCQDISPDIYLSFPRLPKFDTGSCQPPVNRLAGNPEPFGNLLQRRLFGGLVESDHLVHLVLSSYLSGSQHHPAKIPQIPKSKNEYGKN